MITNSKIHTQFYALVHNGRIKEFGTKSEMCYLYCKLKYGGAIDENETISVVEIETKLGKELSTETINQIVDHTYKEE